MWTLLQQVPDMGRDSDRSDASPTHLAWNDDSSDLPQAWKDTVARCVEINPNERASLAEVLQFWERESARYQSR